MLSLWRGSVHSKGSKSQDALQGSASLDDAYDGSVSERQSEAASSTIHRPAGRMPTRTTSLRSSAASSDGLYSPGNAQRSCNGASSLHSYFTGGAHSDPAEGLAPAFEAGPVGSSHSLFSNQEYGLGLDAQRRALSPEAGVHMCICPVSCSRLDACVLRQYLSIGCVRLGRLKGVHHASAGMSRPFAS